ncbi:hypothetical protein CYY_003397 [Polysphondylium violaceum]|uniref:G domain-containing protein n=1 Tax=Polysphondylium violaceum TaxID=133409 RepID=A0A8J4PXS9_9MYCE|nr:hypothetical protein CYY_003397 [Polysphondylium violaceum]
MINFDRDFTLYSHIVEKDHEEETSEKKLNNLTLSNYTNGSTTTSDPTKENEIRLKTQAKEINSRFIQTLSTTTNYVDHAFHSVSHAADFIKESTSFYKPTSFRKNTIMILGPSGAGKSTLLNYICGVPMVVKDDDQKTAIFPLDPSSSISIVGQGNGSTTFLPTLISPTSIPGYEDCTFVDCPGDFDSNGAIFEILNEISKYKIGNGTKKLKLVLLFPQSSFTSAGAYGGGIFFDTLKKVQILVNDVLDLIDNIYMVFTHARANANTPKQTEAALNNILNSPTNGLGEFKPILEKILATKRYGFLCRPSDDNMDGDEYDPPLFSSKQELLNGIAKVEFKDIEGSNRFKLTTSNDVYDLVDGYYSKGKHIIGAIEIVSCRIVNYFKSYFTQISNSKVSLDIHRKDMISYLNQIINISDTNISFYDFIIELISKLNQNSIFPKVSDNVYSFLECLEFYWKFSKRPQQVSLNESYKSIFGLSTTLTNIFSELESIKKPNFIISQDQKTLVVQGYDLELAQVYEKVKPEMTDVIVLALNQVKINCKYQKSSQNLSIYANTWVINEQVEINLSGKDGPNQDWGAHHSGKGLPGSPGGCGGHFYGVIGESATDLSNLKIISNGGRGGNGSNGHEGETDRSTIYLDFKNHNIELDENQYSGDRNQDKNLFVNFFRDFCLIDNHTVVPRFFKRFDFLYYFHKWFLSKNDINETTIHLNKKNIKSGNKGGVMDWVDSYSTLEIIKPGRPGKPGGRGGYGGRAGKINLFNLSSDKMEINVKFEANNGANGQNGSQGRTGMATSNKIDVLLACDQKLNRSDPQECRFEKRGEIVQHCFYRPESQPALNPNTENIKDPIECQDNYIASKQEFIQFVLSTNVSLKKIDILDNLFIKRVINTCPFPMSVTEIISRLISIEKCYSELHDPTLLLFYQQLKMDLTTLVSQHKSPLSGELISTIKYIYQLICTGVFRYRSYKDTCIVVNMKPFLHMILENIKTLETLRKTDVVNMYKKSYHDNIQTKIEEAMDFVDTVQQRIQECEQQLEIDTLALINESKEEIVDIKKQNEKLETQKSQIQKHMIARMALNGLKIATTIGCTVAFGPAGLQASGAINQGVGIVGDLAIPDDPQINPGVKPVQLINPTTSNKLLASIKSNTFNEKLSALEFDISLSKYHQDIKTNPTLIYTKPDNSNLSIDERIMALNEPDNIKHLDKNKLVLLKDLEIRQAKINGRDDSFVNQLKNKRDDMVKKISNFQEHHLEMAVVVANTAASMIQDGKATKSKIDQINATIDSNNNAMIQVAKNIYEMEQFLTNQIDDIKSFLGDQKYQESSRVGLFKTQFKSKEFLREIQSFVSSFPKSDRVSICTTVFLLGECMETLVALFDKVQVYKEQQDFSNFISDVINGKDDPLNHIYTHKESIKTVIELSHRNTLVDQYNRAKIGFEQWCFPFSSYYLEGAKFNEPNTSILDKTILSAELKIAVNNLLNILDTDLSTIITSCNASPDKNIMTAKFNTSSTSAGPFFVWPHQHYGQEAKNLLAGEEISLVADTSYAQHDIIKFTKIFLSIRAQDKEENNKLQSILKHFDVCMTHSGVSFYKFNDNIYKVDNSGSSGSLTLVHQMNDPESNNQAYSKLSNNTPLLSPYTTWKFKLAPTNQENEILFQDLEKFDRVNIYLNGKGTYFNDNISSKSEKDELSVQIQSNFSDNIFSIPKL